MIKKKNKARRIANVGLIVMAVGFLGTIPFEEHWYIKLLQGGFEAGLVGGLADWFAVTALFRHPLGISIPHTALLPKNRVKITESILHIVENDWLKKESIVEKLKNIHFSVMLLEKAEKEVQKETFGQTVKHMVRSSFTTLEKQTIRAMVDKTTNQLVGALPTRKITEYLVDKTLEGQYEVKAYETLLVMAEKKLAEPQTRKKITEVVLEIIDKKAKSTMFSLILKPMVSLGREKVEATVHQAIDETMRDLQSETSVNRQQILQYIRAEMEKIKENEQLFDLFEQKKQTFANGKSLEEFNEKLTDIIYEKVEKTLSGDTFYEEKLIPLLHTFIKKIQKNEETMAALEQKAKEAVATIVDKNHSKIGTLVRDNLDKLTTEQLVDMMENNIGKELAWIRVNGSLCGFMIGVALASIIAVIHLVL